jgi:nucleoside-diphosphate kinase
MANYDPRKERTLFLVKPDGVQRGLIGEIISRFEKKGLKLAAMKMVLPSKKQVKEHYSAFDDAWRKKVGGFVKEAYDKKGEKFPYKSVLEAGRAVQNSLERYLSCGPIVAMVIEGAHAIKHVRKLTGATNPLEADIGTIRGDFTIESLLVANTFERTVRNLAHSSEDVQGAEREIKVWFKDDEVIDYHMAIDKVLYDPTWDKIGDEEIEGLV